MMGKNRNKDKTNTFRPYCKTLPDQILLEPLKNRREQKKWWQFFKRKHRDYFRVAKDFRVVVSENDFFVVKEGFKTDLASIPEILQSIWSPLDNIHASIVHDFLYRDEGQKFRGRPFSDGMFDRIMKETNVRGRDRKPNTCGVTAFGGFSYQKSKRSKAKKSLQSKKI